MNGLGVALVTFLFAFGQADDTGVVNTVVCEIAAHPDRFDGKRVQVRAIVDTGVDDLPAGMADDTCHGELKFFMPDDAHFAKLLKSKGYRKLVKDAKKNRGSAGDGDRIIQALRYR